MVLKAVRYMLHFLGFAQNREISNDIGMMQLMYICFRTRDVHKLKLSDIHTSRHHAPSTSKANQRKVIQKTSRPFCAPYGIAGSACSWQESDNDISQAKELYRKAGIETVKLLLSH